MNICKRCNKNKKVTLTMCKDCSQKHNKQTRELKRKYRKEGKCCMCGKKSTTRRCEDCQNKNEEYVKNSPYLKSKKAKTGCYGTMKELINII